MDGAVYGCVGDSVFRVVGDAVAPWGYPTPVGVFSNGGSDSKRKAAVTFSDASGLESGASPVVRLGSQITVPEPPEGAVANVFASAEDGDELYFQFSVSTAGTYEVPSTNEEGRVLGTQYLTQPPPAEYLTSYSSMIFGASGNVVYHTSPMQPHHVDTMENFLFYPAPVVGMAAGNAGLYVGADKLYLLIFGETGFRQTVVSEHPPMVGALIQTDDGYAVAMTAKGLMVERVDDGGNWRMVNVTEPQFSIADHESAALGEVDYDGEKLIVSSVRDRKTTGNGLAASDYFETEVVRP